MSTLSDLRRFEAEVRAQRMTKHEKNGILIEGGWNKISNRRRLPDGTELPFGAAVIQQLVWNADKGAGS
jgi:hypothetical protein